MNVPSRLRALELGGDAAQLELAHAMIRAALELEREPPARAVHLAPRLFEPGELADARDERQQDLALDDLGLRARRPNWTQSCSPESAGSSSTGIRYHANAPSSTSATNSIDVAVGRRTGNANGLTVMRPP